MDSLRERGNFQLNYYKIYLKISAYASVTSYLVVGISKVSSRLNDFDDPRSFHSFFSELVSSLTDVENFFLSWQPLTAS
uniref:Ovule protein n=1 Tax=Ascaris lumbricoides TaxID=6252 RepID=A0A0M3ICV8_ASCLU